MLKVLQVDQPAHRQIRPKLHIESIEVKQRGYDAVGRPVIERNGNAVGQKHKIYYAIMMATHVIKYNHTALSRRLRTMLLWIILMV